MHKVSIEQWGVQDDLSEDRHNVWAFPDSETVNNEATTPSDRNLALKVVAGSLYDFGYEVIALKRDTLDESWLALCLVISNPGH